MDSIPELTKLIEENEASLLRYANRLLRNQESARDAVQEAFVRFVRTAEKDGHDKIANATAWLYRTTRNYCLDHLRSKKFKLEVTLDEEICTVKDSASTPDKTAVRNDEIKMLRKMINKLEPRDREVLILKMEQGKSYKEIAEIMELSVSNVGFILHNTIKKLQQQRQEIASGMEG